MSKYAINSVSDLVFYSDRTEGTNYNITIQLRTPAGYTSIRIDPLDLDIKNMTIAELERLAIDKLEQSLL